MTDWKPGDLCQVNRGKRWVDAEVFASIPNNGHRVVFGNGRTAWVGDDDLRPRPAKRGKLGTVFGLNGPDAERDSLGPSTKIAPTPLNRETDLRPVPKPKTARSKDYLAHVRTFPCCSCGATEAIYAHHVASGGMGSKASDYLTAPLCGPCHSHWHAKAELPGLPGYDRLSLNVEARAVLWEAAAKCLAAWVERD